jgi:hypothetical protein
MVETGLDAKSKTCVIISYWVGRPAKDLNRLLAQMQKIDAGAPFDILIVCNGGLERPLSLPPRYYGLRLRILNRENTGYNLGAWDHGWRNADGYAYYLFLQDDCFLKRPNWVFDFGFRMSRDMGIGLLGEAIMWDRMTWRYIREATDRDLGRLAWPEDEPIHPLDTYQALLDRRGIPRGEVGTHLPSLILFTSRQILNEIGGFPIIGSSYREAVASEIGISRLIESRGYRITKLKDRSFELIGHRQWTKAYRMKMQLRERARSLLRRLGLKRRRRTRLTGDSRPAEGTACHTR